MTTKEKIEALDVISDVFLESNNHFKTELEVGPHYCIDVESGYDNIVDGIQRRALTDINSIKFRITSRVTANHNYENRGIQRRLVRTGIYIIDRFPHLEKRISTLLPDLNIKYRKFILIAVKKGLVILPLFEKDKDEIEEDSKDRMTSSGHYFSSYEKNITEINTFTDVQIGHIMIFIKMSKPVLKKIKRFKWF